MRLLTLNTHSLVELDYELKRRCFVTQILREPPDVIALQEVNQSCDAPPIPPEALVGLVPCREAIVIRQDNPMAAITAELYQEGLAYQWSWLPIKKGYGRYDEGIAVMSRLPIEETRILHVSGVDDYDNWKTRKLLGIRTKMSGESWFYSVHMGWWNDTETSFQEQWRNLQKALQDQSRVWLMGDFNSPAERSGEGYDLIRNSGWHDTYHLAREKDRGITVVGSIDGWKDKGEQAVLECGLRMDYIFCREPAVIYSSEVIFNGRMTPRVSDHFGVQVVTGEAVK